jgi:hypothetical protein
MYFICRSCQSVFGLYSTTRQQMSLQGNVCSVQKWTACQRSWYLLVCFVVFPAFGNGTAFVSLSSDSALSSLRYHGEIGFFDNYIVSLFMTVGICGMQQFPPLMHQSPVDDFVLQIPLAKKLKDCGVFGVSSDEYLNYAVQNRAEWEERGEEIVAGMVEECAVDELGDASNNVRQAMKRLSMPSERMIKDASAIRRSLTGAADLRESIGSSARAKGATTETE